MRACMGGPHLCCCERKPGIMSLCGVRASMTHDGSDVTMKLLFLYVEHAWCASLLGGSMQRPCPAALTDHACHFPACMVKYAHADSSSSGLL